STWSSGAEAVPPPGRRNGRPGGQPCTTIRDGLSTPWRRRPAALQTGCDALNGLRRGGEREYLEVDEGAPRRGPLVAEPALLALHQLIAGRQVGRDPAGDIGQPLRQASALVPESPVDRHRIPVPEPLHEHVEHVGSLAPARSRPATQGPDRATPALRAGS